MSSSPKEYDKLRELLDESYDWPAEYTFKFVVPIDKEPEVISLIGMGKIAKKKSKKGNYISITVTKMMNSSDEIIEIYQKLAIVEGIISL